MSATINSVTLNATDSLQVIVNATPLSGGTAKNYMITDLTEQDLNLGSSSTPPIAIQATLYQTMGGSPITLDLTAIVDALFGSQDFSGGGGSGAAMKVQFLKIINQGSNKLVIEPGASNPYYFDSTNESYKIVVPAGGSVKLRLNDAAADVTSACKTIKLTGTASDVYWLQFIGG